MTGKGSYNLVLGGKRVTIYDHRQSSKRGMKYFNIGADGYMGPIILAQIISAHRGEKVHPKETSPRWLEDKRHHEQVKSIDEHPDLTYERAMEFENYRNRSETFNSYKVAPELSSYTKEELIDSKAGPQGTDTYDEMEYDPIAQDRQSAESFASETSSTLTSIGYVAGTVGVGYLLFQRVLKDRLDKTMNPDS